MSQIAGLQDLRQEGPPADIGIFQFPASNLVFKHTFSGTTYVCAVRAGDRGWVLIDYGINAGTVIQSALDVGGLTIVMNGTYLILQLDFDSSPTLSLLGETPGGVIFQWNGGAGGTMFNFVGTSWSRSVLGNFTVNGNDQAITVLSFGGEAPAAYQWHNLLLNISIYDISTGTGLKTGTANGKLEDSVILNYVIGITSQFSCGIGVDYYSSGNVFLGGILQYCSVAGIRFNRNATYANFYGTKFMSNQEDILVPTGFNAYGEFTDCWFETSVDSIISSNTVGAIQADFKGCTLHTSDATYLFDLDGVAVGGGSGLYLKSCKTTGVKQIRLDVNMSYCTIEDSGDFTTSITQNGFVIADAEIAKWIKISHSNTRLINPFGGAALPVDGTEYQNNRPYPILIFGSARATANGEVVCVIYLKSSTPADTIRLFAKDSTMTLGDGIPFSFVVPPYWYYKFDFGANTYAYEINAYGAGSD